MHANLFLFQDFTPQFDESFDPSYNIPVPGDTGFNNPIYDDMYNTGVKDDIEEVNSAMPPSFLDTIGFTPDDFNDAVNSAEFGGGVGAPQINVEIVDEFQTADAGESEA